MSKKKSSAQEAVDAAMNEVNKPLVDAVMSAVVEPKLTVQQRLFIHEYLIDLNASAAAIRAGYSEHTSRSIGSELMQKPEIKEQIQAAMEARGERTKITADRVLQEIEHLALFDPVELIGVTDIQQIKHLPEDVRRAIVGWSWDKQGNFIIKLAKEKALEMLARHHQLLNTKIEVTGKLTLEDLVAGSIKGDE